jgi:hypothetical protein
VTLNFSTWANGPGAGKGRSWTEPKGKYGVAQLSPWVLWPPDGLNLKQGARGELFGYGYLPLPLTDAKSTTAGIDVPTGNHSWTLFLNTGNFKGPVTFFTPYFFSSETAADPTLAGLFLDGRPSDPNRHLQMETQHIPSARAVDENGVVYARVAPTSFPRGANGESPLVHRVTSYDKTALWNAVEDWFEGGEPASGAVGAGRIRTFTGEARSTWKIYTPDVLKKERVPLDWDSFATPTALDSETFGYKWNEQLVTENKAADGMLYSLPEYYRLTKNEKGADEWVVVQAKYVPPETGLAGINFARPDAEPPLPYITPDDPASCWKTPGPVAGPFEARPGDGTIVTYYWYRFADQPALLNADLTDKEREDLQKRVEKLHRHWKKDRDYLPPPAIGELAEIDPALIVVPPKGLEVGYVPIATRQEKERK